MEPPTKQVRLVLPLLKAPITNITDRGFSILIGAAYGAPTTMQVVANTQQLDLRDGDLITLYTEVLLKPAQGSA